jgi:hypothetical protein
MDLGRAKVRGDALHRLAQSAALMSLLVLALPVFLVTSGDMSARGNATLSPPAAQSKLIREPAPERVGACADGAIDSPEDHDPSFPQLSLPPIRISGASTVTDACARRPSSSDLARSQTARGPPLA